MRRARTAPSSCDPDTGDFEDYGVVVYHDIPAVTDFFARLNVPLPRG